MKRHNLLLHAAQIVLLAGLFLAQSLSATVTFTVTPAAVSNTYYGYITLQITGLTNGQTAVVQKYLDANTNGVVDAGDSLMEQFKMTDGQAGMVIGGVTNFNVPGDTDGAANGTITAKLNFHSGDFIQTTIGNYLFVVSSTNGQFAAITNAFSVTNFPYAQEFTGTVVSNSTSTVVSNAVVIIFPPPRSGNHGPGTPLGAVVANNSGVYTIKLPVGSYMPVAFRSNYVGNLASAPVLALTNGQTVTTNLTLSIANSSVSGSFVDINTPSKGLPGVFMPLLTSSELIAAGFTDSNGNFNVPVSSGQSWSVGSYSEALIAHGYVAYDNTPTNVSSGATGVTVGFYKATALVYGNVSDNSGNPLAGIAIEAYDQPTNIYDMDGLTDTKGNYVTAVVGGLGSNELWQVDIDQDPTNYAFTQPQFSQYGGTNISAGQAVQVNFTGLATTNAITGHVQNSSNNAIAGVQVNAYAIIGGNYFQTSSVETDSNGNYTLAVGNTNTWYVNLNYCCGSSSLSGLGDYEEPPNDVVTINNNSGTANFTVSNCAGPVIYTTSLPGGQVNTYYDFFLQGATCSGNLNWSLIDPLDFPSGLNLSQNGEINGTPSVSGPYNFSVQLSDGNGNTTNQSLSLTINPAAVPLQVTTLSLPGGTNGVFYSQTLAATGGQTPYSWSLEPGSANLPANLTLGTNGVISGTPGASASNYQFIVQVMDADSAIADQALAINITGGLGALQLTTASLPNGTNGVFYSTPLAASGGTPPYTWSLAPGSANPPANLALGTNGVLSGMPNVSGTNLEFIAEVTDSASNFAQRVESLTIVASTNAPMVSLALVRQAGNGTLEFTFSTTAGQNYSVQSSPDLKTWSTTLTFTGSGGLETISVPTTGRGPAYYRVKIGP